MTVDTKIGLEMDQPASPVATRDELYHWENASFLVRGDSRLHLERVPSYQFIAGSEFFATKYLHAAEQPQDDWSAVSGETDSESTSKTAIAGRNLVALEDVSAPQFRTFLKLLFPIHSTSTTLTLTKSEWLTILTLSTRWHFLELRGLAIRHLQCQMTDPIEMIQVGRACYVSRWVTDGYKTLINKRDAISEEESEAIGDRTAVRLYIIRHELASSRPDRCIDGNNGKLGRQAGDLLSTKFADELESLKLMEGQRKAESDLVREKEDAQAERLEAERLEAERSREKAEEERLHMEAERKRLAAEEIERERHKDAIRRAKEEEKRKLEEERRSEAKKAEELQRKAMDNNSVRPHLSVSSRLASGPAHPASRHSGETKVREPDRRMNLSQRLSGPKRDNGSTESAPSSIGSLFGWPASG